MVEAYVPTVDDLLNVATVDLLSAGGVNNWEWYDDCLAGYDATHYPNTFAAATAWVNALSAGGVDNWDGYEDSLEGLYEYNVYLDELDEKNSLSKAVGIYDFLNEENHIHVAVNDDETYKVNAVVPDPVALDVADRMLFDYIVERFGADKGQIVYDAACSKPGSIWAKNAFPVEFGKAIKILDKNNTLADVKIEYIKILMKGKKLDPWLDSVVY